MNLIARPRPDQPVNSGPRMHEVFFRWVDAVTNRLNGAPEMPEHIVAELPPANGAKRLIFVTDMGGGAGPAYNDGTDWRRVIDGTVVS